MSLAEQQSGGKDTKFRRIGTAIYADMLLGSVEKAAAHFGLSSNGQAEDIKLVNKIIDDSEGQKEQP